MRIAQHVGIHSEASLAKCTVFEAEMRRRLWWALVLFDSRMAEMAGCMNVTYLVPVWDCKVPLNVNDSELRPEMREPPTSARVATEAIFAVARAEFGEFVRHAAFQLDFTCPWLKPLAKDPQHPPTPDGSVMPVLERVLEQKYLQVCDPNNSLHYMTIWMTRSQLARSHLIEHFSKNPDPSKLTEEQRGAAFAHALRALVCNTRIMTSPLTKKLRWLTQFYYPFPAYVYISQELKRRPLWEQADKAWAIMSENYGSLYTSFFLETDDRPLFRVFVKPILAAWDAREAALSGHAGVSMTPPVIVQKVRHQLELIEQDEGLNLGMGDTPDSSDLNYFAMSMPVSSDNQLQLDVGLQPGFQMPLGIDAGSLGWGATKWI